MNTLVKSHLLENKNLSEIERASEPYQASNVLYRFETIDKFYQARYSLNPYRGCNIGCKYCYIQENKFPDISGTDKETKSTVKVKINAPYLLKQKLESEVEPSMIVIGESCEPYSEIEGKYFITRRLLEILADYNFPIHVITKSSLILRDIEIINRINEENFVCISISIPIISKNLFGIFEGKSDTPKDRFETIKTISRTGVITGVSISPIIPYFTDKKEINAIVRKAAKNGAKYVLYKPLQIKKYQREKFFFWLKERFPKLNKPYRELYENGSDPSGEYLVEIDSTLKEICSSYGIRLGMPFKADILHGYFQELLKI